MASTHNLSSSLSSSLFTRVRVNVNEKLGQEYGLFSSWSGALFEMRCNHISVIGALPKAARALIIHTATDVACRSLMLDKLLGTVLAF